MAESLDDDITLLDVTKTFRLGILKKKVAVEDLTLSVPRGQIVGLLGPNGSGKSTTLKMILGFLRPTSGTILIGGKHAGERAARAMVGYLPETPRFQKFLRAVEVLAYYGKLYGIPSRELRKRIEDLLDLVGLKHAGSERVQGFSKGMTQRLAIAQALLNRPRLLIFDEPMSGLDPLGRMEIRRLIARIYEEMPHSTIFFSSHVLGDVEALCSHVAVLRAGRLTTFCPIPELVATSEQRFDVVIRELSPDTQERLVRDWHARPTPLGLTVAVDGTDTLVARLDELKTMGAVVVGISSQRKGLEEALFGEPGQHPVRPPSQPARLAGGMS